MMQKDSHATSSRNIPHLMQNSKKHVLRLTTIVQVLLQLSTLKTRDCFAAAGTLPASRDASSGIQPLSSWAYLWPASPCCAYFFFTQVYQSLQAGRLSDLSAFLIPPVSQDYGCVSDATLSAGREAGELGEVGGSWLQGGEESKASKWMRPIRAQGLLKRLMLLVGFAVVLATGHSSASPAIAGAVMLPSIARSRYIEYRAIRSGEFGNPPFLILNDAAPMFFGCLENYDDFSDGAVIGAMMLQDAVVHPRFVGSFLYSSSAWVRALAPAMDMLHMWRLALLCLFLGQAAQWAVPWAISVVNDATSPEASKELEERANATSFESVGFNALAERHAREVSRETRTALVQAGRPDSGMHSHREKDPFRLCTMGVARVLLENGPSGLIAASFVMFTGVDNLLEQPIGLACAILSAAAMFKKSVDLLLIAVKKACMKSDSPSLDCCSPSLDCCAVGTLFILGLAIGLVDAWIIAKLWFIQTCPDHAWELTAGCMKLD